MGNALSEEEQDQMMEEAYNLEDPGADKQLNSGTSAPNCQPKHTQDDSEHTKSQRSQEERRKRQNGSSASLDSHQEQDMDEQKKLSYFQMAKMGYQELVNAIIRPPRADYKVRGKTWIVLLPDEMENGYRLLPNMIFIQFLTFDLPFCVMTY